jgi:5'(3')-deoxyribonucleotidase
MRIGIDLDGVSADFIPSYAKACAVKIDPEQLTHWTALEEIVPFGHGVWEWLEHNDPKIFHDLTPIPGAIEGIKELRSNGHTIVIITARPKWAKGSAEYWLNTNNIPYDEIHETHDKTSVSCDIYIDDADHNLKELSHIGHTIRMVQPWNSHQAYVYDANNWPDILEIIRNIEYVSSTRTNIDSTV